MLMRGDILYTFLVARQNILIWHASVIFLFALFVPCPKVHVPIAKNEPVPESRSVEWDTFVSDDRVSVYFNFLRIVPSKLRDRFDTWARQAALVIKRHGAIVSHVIRASGVRFWLN